MRFVLVAMIMSVAGCDLGVPTTLVTKPADGYPALRFVEAVRVGVFSGAIWEFKPGSVLVGDRTRGNGELLYCGTMEAVGQQFVCAIKRGSKLVVLYGVLQRPIERDIPPGAIEEFRFR